MKVRLFVYVSLAVDITIAAAKFIASAVTGSSSMTAEGIHSVIDAISQVFLIWGEVKSKKKADDERPFGYGRELYFWSFIVSLIIFLLGGCISFYQGLMRFKQPAYPGSAGWNYSILAIAFIFTCISLFSALKVFNKQRGDASFLQAVTQSKDPAAFIVLLGDMGDILGLVIAFLGVYLGRRFHNPYYDGGATMIIGAMLIAISLLLVRESKSLLIGEPTNRKTLRRIVALAEADKAVIKVRKNFSTYLAPDEVVLELVTVFKENLTTLQITTAIERITTAIQAEFPRIKQIFIEPVADKA